MSILEMKKVTYRYQNKYQTVEAVKEADYAFEEGKIYAIVGKSGSGKTTILSVLAGLDLPTVGEVLFDGKATREMDRNAYRRNSVTVIYQHFNLLPLLSILENVMYPMELVGVERSAAKERAKELLSSIGLTSVLYNRLPAMLSGGEQQRVAIARALATKARVILADEPTGNLDEDNTANIMKLLFELAHEKNYCIIIVTHDMAVAHAADIRLRVSDGRLLAVDEEKSSIVG